MDRKADLHCHSIYSDGSCRPSELVDLAIDHGFVGLSIVDHDTVEAFEEGYAYAASKGLIFLPGVEISAKFEEESIHVLGYSFDPKSRSLQEFCRLHQLRREKRNQQILDNLGRRGMSVTMEQVKARSPEALTYGRPHIALAMMEKGYAKDVASAFSAFLGAGKSCYVEGEKWTVQEAIDAVHAAKGMAVLAHPHLIKTGRLIKKLLAMPFDGLEAYYCSMPVELNLRWCEAAKKHSFFVTGGSDFHGTIKPDNRFGSSWAPEETFDMLHHHFLSL
jgi:hypothetical protein